MRVASIAAATILLQLNLFAQSNIVSKFAFRSHTYMGTTLQYRLFIPPSYSPAKRYPVVLALHGSGEAGTDNTTQLTLSRMATSWADSVNQLKYPCFVVAPQYAPGGTWSLGMNFPITPETATANNILDSLVREFSIDTCRFYVTGLSDGGFGTWELIMRFPDRFAAAVPMSGGQDPAYASSCVNVPIWNFHGASDDVVPVQYSRQMIDALHTLGRTVVYPLCHYQNCTGLPDSTINMEIRSHADLFYTEYPNLGHVPSLWNESYDSPYLRPWVFDKYKQVPGAIRLTNLKNFQTLIGGELIQWNSSAPGESVEIWFSSDAGTSWQFLTPGAPNSGAYSWNTALVPDCAFGEIKIFLKNADGFIIGSDRSSYFAINNTINGAPFVKVLNDELTTGEVIAQDSLDVKLLIGDPKKSPLSASILFSADGGSTFDLFDSYPAQSDTAQQTRRIAIGSLPNSTEAVIAFSVSNGVRTSRFNTPPFPKLTPRTVPGPTVGHITGQGAAKPVVHIVNPLALTGHEYQITFDDTSTTQKQYAVRDVTRGVYVVQHATELNSVAEGPLFDGIRLVIGDPKQAYVDTGKTHWVGRTGVLHGYAFLVNRTIGQDTYKGVPDPYDYSLTLFNSVVDTSKDGFGLPPTPMKFNMRNLTKNKQVNVAYYNENGSNSIGSGDEVDILEPDSAGNPRLSWGIVFISVPGDTMPVPGNEFRLYTVKPVTSADVYDFVGAISSVASHTAPIGFSLQQNYPNPFNPTTTIGYTLAQRSPVHLTVFNVLGQRVVELVDRIEGPGYHQVTFDGSNVASGVYFYQLQAGSYLKARKMLIIR
jgi:predicted esterase